MPLSLPDFPDLDEVFAYKTKKVVVIKDRLLGFLWYSGVLGVMVYFAVDRIIVEQAHYVREPVMSVVETSLKAPSTLRPKSELHYCRGGPTGDSQALPCVTGPDVWVRAPSTGNAELFVATRLKDLRNGSDPHYSYIQDPERYTVGISFALQAPQLHKKTGDAKYTRSMADLNTFLLSHDGKLQAEAVHRISRFDVIELNMLLQAAGIANASSIRYKGAVLLVAIHCPMRRDGSVDHCMYTVRHLQNVEAKAYLAQELHIDDEGIEVQERRGVKIVVTSTGEMGQFKWSAFMVAWVSAFGMLGIIRFFVDLMMAKVMPLKGVYKLLKWEQSVDFSDYKHGEPHAVAQVKHLQEQAERFHRDKEFWKSHAMRIEGGSDGKKPIASAGSSLAATSGGTDLQGSTAAAQGEREADERCEEHNSHQALQVKIGNSSDDPLATGKPHEGRFNAQPVEPGATTAPASSQHVQEIIEYCLARLLAEQQKLREELAASADAHSTELDQCLRKHIVSEISQEREKLNSWAQQSLTKQLSTDFSCQQQDLQVRIESRLTDIVSKTVAGSHGSLQQILREEHIHHLEQAKGSLQQLLRDELGVRIAQATGNLHKQVQTEMASNLVELRRQLAADLTAFREQQQKELHVELSKLQEQWKPLVETTPEEEVAGSNAHLEELTRQLVSWQPESSTLMDSELPASSVSLPQPQSFHSAGAHPIQESWTAAKAGRSMSARQQDAEPASGSAPRLLPDDARGAAGPLAERALPALSPLPSPMDLPEVRLKAELASLKDELVRRTQEEQRRALPMRTDSNSRSASEESKASTPSITDSFAGREDDAATLHSTRQTYSAASGARDIW